MSALSNVDIKRELDKNIVIEEFSESSLTPLGYDLRIGAIIYKEGDKQILYMNDTDEFEIPSNSSVRIISKEFLWISEKILATIHSRGSFSAKGLILNSTTVDPNWSGCMAFSLFNFSNQPIKIKVGDKFSTVIFYYCHTPTFELPISRAIEGLNDIGTSTSYYDNSRTISKIRSSFEEKKQKATSRISYIIPKWYRELKPKINNINIGKTFLIFLLVLSVFTLISFPLGIYGLLKIRFNWQSDYSITAFFSNLAIVVSLAVAVFIKK